MLNRINRHRKLHLLRQQLRPHTTALNLFWQCAVSLALGLVMLLNDSFFLARTKQLVFCYFVFVVLSGFMRIFVSEDKSIKQTVRNIVQFLSVSVISFLLWKNIQSMFIVIPIALSLWLMILSISSFITFVQYRDEKNVSSIRHFFAAVGNVGFAMLFIVSTDDPVSASVHILGVYCICLGVSIFLDFLSKVVPSRFQNRVKKQVRIAPPLLLTALVPQSLMNGINEIFKETQKEPPVLKAENIVPEQEKSQIQVEVFIHVSKSIQGTAGHVDLAIGDTIYCYGAYDKQQSKKYGGVAGAGVMYEVQGKEEYLSFCKIGNKETIFGFGIALSEEEFVAVQETVAGIKARAYPWQCPAQIAMQAGQSSEQWQDFPSRLSRATKVSFYKFKRGNYKHYWMLGTNCVIFVDDLLKAGGMKTLLTGIITPGSYYEFLNAEFLKGSSVIVKREIYTKEADEKAAAMQQIATDINTLAAFCGTRSLPQLTQAAMHAQYGIVQADVMVLFGGSILCGADVLAQAMRQGVAKKYIIVGGAGHTTQALRDTMRPLLMQPMPDDCSEASLFAAYLAQYEELQVDAIETASTNCGNNITFLLDLLAREEIPCQNIILAQDATMQHRMMATLQKYHPEWNIINYATYAVQLEVQGQGLAYQSPPRGIWPIERYASLLLGEIPRLTDDENGYGPRGANYIASIEIPQQVTEAFARLQGANLAEVRTADPRYKTV